MAANPGGHRDWDYLSVRSSPRHCSAVYTGQTRSDRPRCSDRRFRRCQKRMRFRIRGMFPDACSKSACARNKRRSTPAPCLSSISSWLVRSQGCAIEKRQWQPRVRMNSPGGNLPSTSVHLAADYLNGQQERTNAFIVPQRFPQDRPAGEIEYRPTDAGTMKVSA